jgi:hypothetical protein
MSTKLIFATMFSLGITALSLLFLAGSAGAAPSEEWNGTFRGAGNASAHSVRQTADGGYIFAEQPVKLTEGWQAVKLSVTSITYD